MLPAVVRGSIVLRPGVTVSLACTCDTGVMSGDIRSLLTLKGDIVVVGLAPAHRQNRVRGHRTGSKHLWTSGRHLRNKIKRK